MYRVEISKQDQTIGPVNIGNPVEYTVKELAEQIIELTGSRSAQDLIWLISRLLI